MNDSFRVRVTVRGYEVGTQGHLNWAEYLHYAEHAFWGCLTAAGITQQALLAAGFGPAVLGVQVRFHRELRSGDDIDVTCAFIWGDGRAWQIRHDFLRPDGDVTAELTSTCGLLDLRERELVPEPAKHLRSLAASPAILSLD